MRRAVIGILLLTALLGACRPFGGSSSSAPSTAPIPGKDVEQTINDKLPPQLHGVQKAGNARCPAQIRLGKHKTAECTMVADGQKVDIKVAQDGSGYKVSLDQAVVSVTVLEQNLASTYHQQFTFYCGGASLRVVNPGARIQCQGTPTGGGKTKLFDVTIKDTSGKYQSAEHTS